MKIKEYEMYKELKFLGIFVLLVSMVAIFASYAFAINDNLVSATSTNPGATTTPTSTVGILDHFKCYQSEGENVNDLAFLRDQFGKADNKIEKDIVTNPSFFCNPVRKIHETAGAVINVGISNINNHLTWYNIKPAMSEQFKPRKVLVTNQFVPNGQKLHVIRPEYLVVPTQKVSIDGKPTGHDRPTNIDHFKCYRVAGAQIPVQNIKLMDQFNAANTFDAFKVIRAQYLCNPTLKAHFLGFNDQTGAAQFNNVPILHPKDHLVCYNLQPNMVANHKLVINNQFGSPQNLTTFQSKMICLPSTKKVITINPDTGTDVLVD